MNTAQRDNIKLSIRLREILSLKRLFKIHLLFVYNVDSLARRVKTDPERCLAKNLLSQRYVCDLSYDCLVMD